MWGDLGGSGEGAHVVGEEVVEVRLDREGLEEELAVEELLGRVAQQHAPGQVGVRVRVRLG